MQLKSIFKFVLFVLPFLFYTPDTKLIKTYIMKIRIITILIGLLLLRMSINAQTFQDNPNNGSAGDFPSKWDLIKGTAQIGTLGGSKVILISNNGIITPQLGSKNYLAETFTLKFDAYFDEVRKTVDDEYYQVRFWDGMTHLTFASQKGNGFYNPIQIYRYRVRVVGRSNGSDRILHDAHDNNLKGKEGVWKTIAILYNKGLLKILIDDVQILNHPDFLIKPAMISIEGVAHEFGVNHVRAIKNIRLDGIVNTGIATTNPADTTTNTSEQTGNNISSGNTGIKINDLLDGKSDPEGSSVFLGLNAGAANTTADNKNTGLGFEALKNNTSGKNNIAIGHKAGLNNITGSGNVFLGNNSGFKEKGSNKLYIENDDADANNALIYGEFDNNILRTNGRFQIGNPGNGGYSFPALDGNSKQVLQTDGRGNLKWVNITSSGDNNIPQQVDTIVKTTDTYSGLEAIDEGLGIGWRLKGRDPGFYGNIGLDAIDLSKADAIGDFGATGTYSFATGLNTTASGLRSTALGNRTLASGEYSTAIGSQTTASGKFSTAMGSHTTASGYNSTTMGVFTAASGRYSVAMGFSTKSEADHNTAIGIYNIGGGSTMDFVATDPLFEIGNGNSFERKNALTVLKNGNTGIGTHQPKVKLQITGGKDAGLSNGSGYVVLGDESKINMVIDNNEILVRNNGASSTLYLQNDGGDVSVGGKIVHTSDMRLKKNINLLYYGLREILKMNPVIYDWKSDSDEQHKNIGLLAQDIQPLIKEVVHIGDDKPGTLSISYTELIPVLIKAIQEQQSIIDVQKKENSEQTNKLEIQNKNYEKLIKRVEQLEKFLDQKKNQ